MVGNTEWADLYFLELELDKPLASSDVGRLGSTAVFTCFLHTEAERPEVRASRGVVWQPRMFFVCLLHFVLI